MKHQKWYEKNTVSLAGKVAVVTGGNSGIGFCAARGFLFLGATVVLACRNEHRARGAAGKLKKEFPTAAIETAQLDLASIPVRSQILTEITSEGISSSFSSKSS